MKVLIVLAHPRENSLVYSLKHKFEQGLIEGGHQVATLDLFKIGFDPVLRQDDEPQWGQGEQVFSEEVHREMERINQHDAVVFCFPLYWSVMPAIMKGYLDRVFNYGYAYAHDRSTTMKLNKVFFMTTAGVSEEGFKKRNHIEFLNHYFNNVIAGYCHIKNSKLRIFDDVRNKKRDTEVHLPQAYQDGLDFDKCENNKNDEVAKYLNGRYISPVEAVWRLFEFAIHKESPSISPLAAHLENEQPVCFDPSWPQSRIDRVLRESRSTLMAYFQYNDTNQNNPNFQPLLCQQFAPFMIRHQDSQKWKPRGNGSMSIGQMYYCNLAAG